MRKMFALAFLLFVAQPALAQLRPNSEREKQEAYSRAFVAGLETLTARKVKQAEALFKQCVKLYPDRPVAHYNLACVYSVTEQPQKAVEALRECFSKGYRDLAHMARDVDLDPIRKSPSYRKAMSDFGGELLQTTKPNLVVEPAGSEPYPVLIYVHDFAARPESALSDLRQALGSWGLCLPRGTVQNPRGGDSSDEFRLISAVRKYLDAHPRADRRRVFIAGDGFAGRRALGAAANHPDLFKAALAAGPGLGTAVDGVDLEGTRAYLIVKQDDPNEVIEGEAARTAFAEAGSPVVLERYPLANPLTRDRAVLLRGLSWLQGRKVQLPGVGKSRVF